MGEFSAGCKQDQAVVLSNHGFGMRMEKMRLDRLLDP